MVTHPLQQKGQAIIFGLLFLAVVLMALLILYNQGQLVSDRIQLENAADATVYSQAKLAARNQNFIAYTNRSMVANETSIGQMVALLTWAKRYGQIPAFTAFPGYNIPIAPPSPVTFKQVLDTVTIPYVIMGQGVTQPVNAVVQVWPTVVSYFNSAIGIFQKMFAVATLAAQAETAMEVVKGYEDDPDDPELYIPVVGWYFFTQNALLTYFGENFDPGNLAAHLPLGEAEEMTRDFLADQVGSLDTMINDNTPALGAKKAKNKGGGRDSHVNTGEEAENKALESYQRYAAIVNQSREPFTRDRHWDVGIDVPDIFPAITLDLGLISMTIDLDFSLWTGVAADGGTAYISNSALESDADIGNLGWSSIDMLSFGLRFEIGLYVELEFCFFGCSSWVILDFSFGLGVGLPLGGATHQVVRDASDAKRLLPQWGLPGQNDTGKWGGDPEDNNNNGAFDSFHAVGLLWGQATPNIYGLVSGRDVTTRYAGPPSFFSLGSSFQESRRSYEFTAAVAKSLDDVSTSDSNRHNITGEGERWDQQNIHFSDFDVQTRSRAEAGDFAADYQQFIWGDDRPMMTISSAETYHVNPMQSLSNGDAEPANLFSPFWDARLREPSKIAVLIATGEIDFEALLQGIGNSAVEMVRWVLSAIGDRLVSTGVDYLLSNVPSPVNGLIEGPIRSGAEAVTDLAVEAVVGELEDFLP